MEKVALKIKIWHSDNVVIIIIIIMLHVLQAKKITERQSSHHQSTTKKVLLIISISIRLIIISINYTAYSVKKMDLKECSAYGKVISPQSTTSEQPHIYESTT